MFSLFNLFKCSHCFSLVIPISYYSRRLHIHMAFQNLKNKNVRKMKKLSFKTEKRCSMSIWKMIFHGLPKIVIIEERNQESADYTMTFPVIKLIYPTSLWTFRDTGSSGKAADPKLYQWHLSLQTNNLVFCWKSHYFCNQIYAELFIIAGTRVPHLQLLT